MGTKHLTVRIPAKKVINIESVKLNSMFEDIKAVLRDENYNYPISIFIDDDIEEITHEFRDTREEIELLLEVIEMDYLDKDLEEDEDESEGVEE